jgi:hypothetical protein
MAKNFLKTEYILIFILVIFLLYFIHQQYQEQRKDYLLQQLVVQYENKENNSKIPAEPVEHIKPAKIRRPSAFPPTYVDDVIDPNIHDADGASYFNYVNRKAVERIVNPLLPPERSNSPVYGVPINVPTRGFVGGFQQVGMLYKDEVADPDKKIGNNSDSTIVALYGRPVDTSRNKWSYYATGDGFQAVKIPVSYKGRKCDTEFGCEEITSRDEVAIPPYNGKFKAEIYDFDKPRYIPSVW